MIVADISPCSRKIRSPIIVLQDAKSKSSKLYIENPDRIAYLKVHFDNCAVIQEKAADFLLKNVTTRRIVIIELKGSHVEEGMKQIERSIAILRNPDFADRFEHETLAAVIVCRERPHGSHIQVLQERILRSLGVVVHVFCRERHKRFDDLFPVTMMPSPPRRSTRRPRVA